MAAQKAWHVAASLLGWRPDEFWNATPTELTGALMPPGAEGVAPGPERIAALMARFPDMKD